MLHEMLLGTGFEIAYFPWRLF